MEAGGFVVGCSQVSRGWGVWVVWVGEGGGGGAVAAVCSGVAGGWRLED